MESALEQESEKLARSWMRHDATVLRDYLVAGVEDPRLNLQSVLSRHFLLRAVAGERHRALMDQEYRFAAAMNCLLRLAGEAGDAEAFGTVLFALKRGGDNAEGLELPRFLVRTFAGLPAAASGVIVPNYLETCLAGTRWADGRARLPERSLDTFRHLWSTVLAVASALPEPSLPELSEGERISGTSNAPGGHERGGDGSSPRPANSGDDGARAAPTALRAVEHQGRLPLLGFPRRLSVLEPACGSANDYRCLEAYGLARWVDYHGFDLCPKNVENARALFPEAHLETGNVFAIAAPDKRFDLCFVHDLFEHLSLAGMEAAVREICRVTRQGICAGFFNMDEAPGHQVRPVADYYWNTLSLARMKELFAGHGFAAQVLHIGAFLRRQTGCEQTHNPNAYTFVLTAT